MKLLESVLILQLCCFYTASQTTEANQTQPLKSSSDLHIQNLAGKCSWTLRMSENRSSDPVPLLLDSVDLLAERVCRDLNCGGVYWVNQSTSSATTCFQDCLHRDRRLQSCSVSVGRNCSEIHEVVCGHGGVRLAGGLDRCSGRVEIWKDGEWGTVCDDQWDLRDANVVCAQLDCGYALNATGQGGPFPPGRGPVHLDDLNCTGQEEDLWTCPSARDQSDCGHKEDAGVVCSEMRAVRLTGGLDRCSGKVEVHRNGSWGTVCDNCWSITKAAMVCSMLQCGPEPLNFTAFNPRFTENQGTPSYFYTFCGAHKSLWQCQEFINIPHLCSNSKPSGVICNGSLGLLPPTTKSPAVVSSTTTAAVTSAAALAEDLPSPELLSTIALSLLLLVFLIINTVLCCLYRRRHAFLLEKVRSTQRAPGENLQNNSNDPVNLVKVSVNSEQTVASSSRFLWTQLSSADSTSVDTDYEPTDPNPEPSVRLSTFHNSQRYRTDGNTLMRPLGLHSLCEEGSEAPNEATAAFTNFNGGATEPQYSRVSKISEDSFDSSSTSSGECYENLIPDGTEPEPEPSQLPVPNPPLYSNSHFLFRSEPTQQASDDEDYTPVSPD